MKYDHIKKGFKAYIDSMTVEELREELETKYGFEFTKSFHKEKYKSTRISKIKPNDVDKYMSECPDPKAA